MSMDSEPRLAPPGAGLPKVELWIARLIFAWRRSRGNRDLFDVRFRAEREIIAAQLRRCDPQSAARRVLIKRIRGLEDSSRYWSVWMTLEHLRIVHRGISSTISSLAKGIKREGSASTAAVKPDSQVDGDVVPAYELSCDELLATVAGIDNLRTAVRYAHPWFGPLDAAGWHALAAGHLKIHRIQIERILQGLATHA